MREYVQKEEGVQEKLTCPINLKQQHVERGEYCIQEDVLG